MCIAEDRKIYGEAYLHRIHQLDGNFICDKHKCLLKIYKPEITERKNSFVDIEKLIANFFDENNESDISNELLLISSDI
ncbi:hypothetical protein [Clostridium sporogenes]|uniref:hypothetical protein n=1 Tax=Clostridium sporogenes TaxID=1509 RepID=UPI003DA4CD0E